MQAFFESSVLYLFNNDFVHGHGLLVTCLPMAAHERKLRHISHT